MSVALATARERLAAERERRERRKLADSGPQNGLETAFSPSEPSVAAGPDLAVLSRSLAQLSGLRRRRRSPR